MKKQFTCRVVQTVDDYSKEVLCQFFRPHNRNDDFRNAVEFLDFSVFTLRGTLFLVTELPYLMCDKCTILIMEAKMWLFPKEPPLKVTVTSASKAAVSKFKWTAKHFESIIWTKGNFSGKKLTVLLVTFWIIRWMNRSQGPEKVLLVANALNRKEGWKSKPERCRTKRVLFTRKKSGNCNPLARTQQKTTSKSGEKTNRYILLQLRIAGVGIKWCVLKRHVYRSLFTQNRDFRCG